MFDKILIANRGEIAVGIIRTCRHLDIRTTAVYSDADSRSLHRQMADDAVYIGETPATDSYLNADKILSAALSADCQAVPPGYGFLSESARFAESVHAAGLKFIGPPSQAIALMGDKIASKALAVKAGVRFFGWAMEARICAEDPARGFTPATGMITRYAEPRGDAVRVDSGVDTGSKIGVHYDFMLAKVICHGTDREDARTGLIEALNGYHIEGVVTNIDFANSVLCQPAFAAGELDTGFIDRHFDGHLPLSPPDEHHLKMSALTAALVFHVRNIVVREAVKPMVSRIGGGKGTTRAHHYVIRSDEAVYEVQLEKGNEANQWAICVNQDRMVVESPDFEFYRRRLKLKIDGRYHRFRLRYDRSFFWITFCGLTRLFEVLP